jgi:hypothetical protein
VVVVVVLELVVVDVLELDVEVMQFGLPGCLLQKSGGRAEL